jgi:hypothetical protein
MECACGREREREKEKSDWSDLSAVRQGAEGGGVLLEGVSLDFVVVRILVCDPLGFCIHLS